MKNYRKPCSTREQGTKTGRFFKIRRKRRNQVGLNFKIDKITVHYFKILEKDKN
jgi:hypothetical protein